MVSIDTISHSVLQLIPKISVGRSKYECGYYKNPKNELQKEG